MRRSLTIEQVIDALNKGEVLSIGEVYGPAMYVEDQATADRYFEALVRSLMRLNHWKKERAMAVAKQNLGYFSGYYNNDVMGRVYKTFCCHHPIFGDARTVTPAEAFAKGCERGEASK